MADTVRELLAAGKDDAPALLVTDGTALTFAQLRVLPRQQP